MSDAQPMSKCPSSSPVMSVSRMWCAWLARIEHEELDQFLRVCGWEPRYVEGDDPEDMHELMATVLDETVEALHGIQRDARTTGDSAANTIRITGQPARFDSGLHRSLNGGDRSPRSRHVDEGW